jgi:hypothetical protein
MLDYGYPTLVAKSAVIPAIGMYYYNSRPRKFEAIPLIVLIFSYIGDVAVLIDSVDFFVYSAYAFFVVYALLLIYAISDIKNVSFKTRDTLISILVSCLLIYLVISVLEMQFSNPKGQNFIYLIYAFILTTLAILVFSGYIAKGSLQYLNFGLAVACFIASDIFYSIKSFYVYSDFIQMLTISMQMLSYYFLVQYFILREAAKARSLKI